MIGQPALMSWSNSSDSQSLYTQYNTEKPDSIQKLSLNISKYSEKINFNFFFSTTKGKKIFVEKKPKLMKIYFEIISFLDLNELKNVNVQQNLEKLEKSIFEECKSHESLKDILNENYEKIEDKYKDLLDDLKRKFQLYYEGIIQKNKSIMKPFLQWYYDFCDHHIKSQEPLNKSK